MMVHRHGVPHRVRFNYCGAFFWMLQIAAILLVVGWVK